MALIGWQATVQDEFGNAVMSPSVTVRLPNGTLATIYDSLGATKLNPFTGTTEGFAQFYANPGKYIVEGMFSGSDTPDWAISLYDDTSVQAIATTTAGYRDAAAASAAAAAASAAASGTNGNIYTTIALGRAAVADGQQFTVVTAGATEAIRYRRDSSTTQTELARFPLSSYISGIYSTMSAVDGFMLTIDGINVLSFSTDGWADLVIGPHSLQIGAVDSGLPGITQDGAVTNITRSGQYWQYRADGVQYIVHDNYANYTPGILDTPSIDIAIRNGQSWNTQIRLSVDLNNEDPTGYTRRRMDNYNTAGFVVPRCEADFTPRIPWDNRAIKRRAYSTDASTGASGAVVGLRYWKPGINRTYDGGSEVDFFTIGDIISLSRQHFLRELRQPRSALVSLQAGRAGTSEEYFLKNGTSFAGSGGTVTAAILAGNTNYFFDNDTLALQQTATIIQNDWFDKNVTYSVETFDQGGAGTTQTADDSHFKNFLVARRSDVNSRLLPAGDGTTIPWLIVPIGFAASKEVDQGYQAVDQCRWSDANAGTKDLAVGPFYHLKLLQESVGQSAIHGTAMHNLRKGMMLGLIEACAISPAWGRVDRFKISGFNHYPGSNKITLTVNSPALTYDPIVIDTTEVAARTQYGFTVRKASNGANIPVTVTPIGNSYIDLVYAPGAVTGETSVLFDYAGFGVAQADAVVGQATQSACQGNIRKAGIFTDPISRLPIDFWLSPERKFVTL